MKTIENSPENRNIGRIEASELAMPGQLRIPKNIAISKHIEQFWNPPEWHEAVERGNRQIDAERKRNNLYADAIGMSYDKSLELPWGQQHLLRALHDAGNDKAARLIAHDLSLTETDKTIHELMVKATAVIICETRRGVGIDEWDSAKAGVTKEELIPIMKEIAKTNADWPIDTSKWQRKLHKELQGLTHSRDNRLGTGFGVNATADYWEIDKKAGKR